MSEDLWIKHYLALWPNLRKLLRILISIARNGRMVITVSHELLGGHLMVRVFSLANSLYLHIKIDAFWQFNDILTIWPNWSSYRLIAEFLHPTFLFLFVFFLNLYKGWHRIFCISHWLQHQFNLFFNCLLELIISNIPPHSRLWFQIVLSVMLFNSF